MLRGNANSSVKMVVPPAKRSISPIKKVLSLVKKPAAPIEDPESIVLPPAHSSPPFPVVGILKWNIPAEWDLCLHRLRCLQFAESSRHHRLLIEYLTNNHRKYWEGVNSGSDPRPERDQIAQLFFNISTIHTMAGEHYSAKAAIEQCVKVEPGLSMGWYALGLACYELDDFGNALLAWNMCIRVFDEINAFPMPPYAPKVQEVILGKEYLSESAEVQPGRKWRLRRSEILHNIGMAQKMKEQQKLRLPTRIDGKDKLYKIPVGVLYGIPGLVFFKDLDINFTIWKKEQENVRDRCQRREAKSKAERHEVPMHEDGARTTSDDKTQPGPPDSTSQSTQINEPERPVISISTVDIGTPEQSYHFVPTMHHRLSRVASVVGFPRLPPAAQLSSRDSHGGMPDTDASEPWSPALESRISRESRYLALFKQPVTIAELSEILKKNEQDSTLTDPKPTTETEPFESGDTKRRAQTVGRLKHLTAIRQTDMTTNFSKRLSMPLPEILTWEQFREHTGKTQQGTVDDENVELLLPMVYDRLSGQVSVEPNITGLLKHGLRSSTLSIPVALSPTTAAEQSSERGVQHATDGADMAECQASTDNAPSTQYPITVPVTPTLDVGIKLELEPLKTDGITTILETRSSKITVPFDSSGFVKAPQDPPAAPVSETQRASFHQKLDSDSNASTSSEEPKTAEHVPSAIGQVPYVKPAWYEYHLRTLRIKPIKEATVPGELHLELLAPTVYVRPEKRVIEQPVEEPRGRQGHPESSEHADKAISPTGSFEITNKVVEGFKVEWFKEQKWTGKETQAEIDESWEESEAKKWLDWERTYETLNGRPATPRAFEAKCAEFDAAKEVAGHQGTVTTKSKRKNKNKKRNKHCTISDEDVSIIELEKENDEAPLSIIVETTNKPKESIAASTDKTESEPEQSGRTAQRANVESELFWENEDEVSKYCRRDARLMETCAKWQERIRHAELLMAANHIDVPHDQYITPFEHREVTPADGYVKIMQTYQHRKEYSQLLRNKMEIFEEALMENEIWPSAEVVYRSRSEVMAESEGKPQDKLLEKTNEILEETSETEKETIELKPVKEKKKVNVSEEKSLPVRSSFLTQMPTPPAQSNRFQASTLVFPGAPFSSANGSNVPFPNLPSGFLFANGQTYHEYRTENGAQVQVHNHYHVHIENYHYHRGNSNSRSPPSTKKGAPASNKHKASPSSIYKSSPSSSNGKGSPSSDRKNPSFKTATAETQTGSTTPTVAASSSAYSTPESTRGAQTQRSTSHTPPQPTTTAATTNVSSTLASYDNSPPIPKLHTPPSSSAFHARTRISPNSTFSWYDKVQASAEKEYEKLEGAMDEELARREKEKEKEKESSPKGAGGLFGRFGSLRGRGKGMGMGMGKWSPPRK